MILGIRTDKPEAELWLADASGNKITVYTWQAHRELAETIHTKIDIVLTANALVISDLTGVVAFLGPGSFTGLRIGMAVANALADSLNIPLAGAKTDTWFSDGCKKLLAHPKISALVPDYGGSVFTTSPKK